MALRKILDYWWIGPVIALCLLAYFGYQMLGSDKHSFLPGKTSSGHYQIETACSSCHTPFEGVKQETCLECHGAGLDAAQDSHSPSVFNDPRSFAMLEVIDATKCITCHSEHIADRTLDKAASVPKDFCYPCHKDIESERPSHKGMEPNSCAASGCHNYHDNQALYEDFLVKHLDEDRLRLGPEKVSAVRVRFSTALPEKKLTAGDQDGANHGNDNRIVHEWAESLHAKAGVNCSACHAPSDPSSGASVVWSDHPPLEVCKNCHAKESKGFTEGKHGMRIASELSPMSPGQARMPMKSNAHDKLLTCNTCHNAHRYDTREAAVKSCLGCHDDVHSKAYTGSPHHRLWEAESTGMASAGTGVSCATCHMPRLVFKENGEEKITVTHNQNANLRPNSKMIRTVCLECHGLGFSMEALADPDLLLNNYFGAPTKKIDSLDMVKARQMNKIHADK